MEKRFSEMSEFEIYQEITGLNDKARKAEQMGMGNELAVYERKITLAKAYLLDPTMFKPKEVYELKEEEGTHFKISYMNGVFAWGHYVGHEDEEETAFPISVLGQKIK